MVDSRVFDEVLGLGAAFVAFHACLWLCNAFNVQFFFALVDWFGSVSGNCV